MRRRHTSPFLVALLAVALAGAAFAQQPGGPTAPAVSEAPPGGADAAPGPAPAEAGPAAPTVEAPASAPAAEARPTLLPAGDPDEIETVRVPDRPVAILKGQSTWEEGFKELTGAFRRLEEGLAKAGIAPEGRPLAAFVETSDAGFTYEAMLPLSEQPAEGAAGQEIRFGRTPSGAALRFVHKGSYEEIDSTYETITTYLDVKGLEARDVFLEEYVEVRETADAQLEINIFVFPK